MRTIRTAMMVGAAAAALACLSGVAAAQSPQAHVMTVQLPGGGVAQIQYTGDVPPQVAVVDAPAVAPVDFPIFAMRSLFSAESPFAMLDRISADMDRQMAAMWRQADALTAQSPSQLTEAAMRNLPAGSQGYSFTSTLSGNGVCVRSVQITSSGNGAAPKVVAHSSGNCAPETAPQLNSGTTGSVNLPGMPYQGKQPDTLWIKSPAPAAPGPAKRPDTLWVRSTNPIPPADMVQQAAARQ